MMNKEALIFFLEKKIVQNKVLKQVLMRNVQAIKKNFLDFTISLLIDFR